MWPGYDEEARYFEEGVRAAKRQELRLQALDLLKPSFSAQLGFLRETALQHVASILMQDNVADAFAENAAM